MCDNTLVPTKENTYDCDDRSVCRLPGSPHISECAIDAIKKGKMFMSFNGQLYELLSLKGYTKTLLPKKKFKFAYTDHSVIEAYTLKEAEEKLSDIYDVINYDTVELITLDD